MQTEDIYAKASTSRRGSHSNDLQDSIMPRAKYDFSNTPASGPVVSYKKDNFEINVPSSSNGKDVPMVEVLESKQPAKSPYPNLGASHNEQCPWGWIVGVILGMASMAFILVVALAPPPGWIPQYIDIIGHNTTAYKVQGSLVVYPNIPDRSDNWSPTANHYHLELAEVNATVIEELNHLLEEYVTARDRQEKNSQSYALCYLEDPTRDRPCYFDLDWLDQDCGPSNSFGYKAQDGKMNPCLFFRVEQTKEWTPAVFSHNNSTLPITPLDPHSIQLLCQQKQGAFGMKKIEVRPHKGFLPYFFPLDAFEPSKYLHPLVSVQVIGIEPGDNATIECQLAAHNSFMLHGSGRVTVSFTYNPFMVDLSMLSVPMPTVVGTTTTIPVPVNDTSATNETVPFLFSEKEV